MELALWANHTARLKDAGMRSRSVLHSRGYSANQTDWKNTWKGTWKRTGKQLVLTLQLAKHHCVRTDSNRHRTATTATKKRSACPEARKNIVLQCEHAVIALWPHNRKPTLPKHQRGVWRCAPKGDDVTINGSPTPWVFGKKDCLLQMGSRRLQYKACP
jgi:hypothetical protein